MKRNLIAFVFLFIILSFATLVAQEAAIDTQTKDQVKSALLSKFGEALKFRIERGVEQAASLWRREDGTAEDFKAFCLSNFIGDPAALKANFDRLELNFEVLYGHFNKMALDLKRALDLDWGDILPQDVVFAQYDPSSHLSDDFFQNKLAFIILLNFPAYKLEEKMKLGPAWTREEWARARMGDVFSSRAPADVWQNLTRAYSAAEAYISEYNVFVGKLVDDKMKTYFPEGLKLITHWNLRDELKARYKDPNGLAKQKMLYQVMLRIIGQDIPQEVINNPALQWDPFRNKVFRQGNEIASTAEPDTRYKVFLDIFRAQKKLDPYFPALPTLIRRRFEANREIPEAEVEKLFTDFISSPLIPRVAKLIRQRLGRPLQPFDIWYDGFRAGGGIREEELDKIVGSKYPNTEAFQADLGNILLKLGFSKEQADFLAPRIQVDAARGVGHAAGAEMSTDKARLRTRIPAQGMNYKGYSIAVHEFGHTVEQTLTLQKVDHYMLRGVPNTGFTEAFAFVFQDRDLDLLGVKGEVQGAKDLKALKSLWDSFEIMSVSLVDMRVWNWLYQNPEATPAQLKEAVMSIAKDIWNEYFAPIIGVKDQPILAIYSHMIDAGLYLPDYPLGHVIEFQLAQYLEGKNLGREMERMCRQGRIIPQLWMEGAVGSKITTQPLLAAAEEALKRVGK